MYNPSLIEMIWLRKFAFFTTFFVVFTLSYGILALIDFLPETPSTTATSTITGVEEVVDVPYVPVTEMPVALNIPSLDRDASIANPESADITVLDAALLHGLVRHPASAKLGEEGNILILGHSSYLPNVFNKSYQALNGIQKLAKGDIITLKSDTVLYTYEVSRVYQSKASDVIIETEVEGKLLTLVTCNSFGSKEDRFIVEAVLVSEKPL